jgi:hypothetical protein
MIYRSILRIKRIHEVYLFSSKILEEDINEYCLLPPFRYMVDRHDIPLEDFAKTERILYRMRNSI